MFGTRKLFNGDANLQRKRRQQIKQIEFTETKSRLTCLFVNATQQKHYLLLM